MEVVIISKIKNNRIGETCLNNQGCLMKIIEYYNNKNITVEFQDEYKYKSYNINYANFKRGQVKNPYYKSFYNIGYLGEIKENNIKDLKSYKFWTYMLSRCYPITDKEKEIHKHYKDCDVCEEWHCFSNFKEWFDENYYEIPNEKMQLDKDILIKNNKTYSPDTCCFVPCNINHIFGTSKASRGEYPIGVYYSKEKDRYYAGMRIDYKKINIGSYKTLEEAFYAYKTKKEERIKYLADKYKEYLPEKVYKALYDWEVEITD